MSGTAKVTNGDKESSIESGMTKVGSPIGYPRKH